MTYRERRPTTPPPSEDIDDYPATDPSTAELVARLARKTAEPAIVKISTDGLGAGLPGEIPASWDYDSQEAKSLDALIEGYRQDPARRKGRAKVDTLRSFIDLTNRHKDQNSVIFARTSWPEPTLTSVIDYHTLDHTARWGDHQVEYKFPVTDEFSTWINKNATLAEQLEFAHFLEEHAAELAEPTKEERETFEPLFKERFASPSELIVLSRGLEIYTGAKLKRQERLQSGERVIEFTEDHTDAAGNKVDIPGLFMVSVPAFQDGAAVRIPARLRYRIREGNIKWAYQLYRWEYYLRNRVKADLDLAAVECGLPSYEGAPELSA